MPETCPQILKKYKNIQFFPILKVPKFGHLKISISRAENFSVTSRFRGPTRLVILYHPCKLVFSVYFFLIFGDFFLKSTLFSPSYLLLLLNCC